MITDLTVIKNAELALVKLGQLPSSQAAAKVAAMTPGEQLAAHSCQIEGDRQRLEHLLDHISTREALDQDLAGYLAKAKIAPVEADPEDGTQTV